MICGTFSAADVGEGSEEETGEGSPPFIYMI